MRAKQLLCVWLCLLVALPLPAQQPQPQSQPSETVAAPVAQPKPAEAKPEEQKPAGKLEIVVVQGEGARNDIGTRRAVPPIVEVRDESGNPVPGAEVVFALPMSGPSGHFYGWIRTQTVRTDEKGRASVSGYEPNDIAGAFEIKVTASHGDRTGTAVIHQINEGRPRRASPDQAAGKCGCKWWAVGILVGAAAAIAGGAVAATQ